MIALSSFKPLDDSAEYAENQRRARASWLKAFDGIRYFNKPDERMGGDDIAFTDLNGEAPSIKRLMECAARAPDWCCIVNADIVVNKRFRAVEEYLRGFSAKCAISRRFNFDPKNMKIPAKSDDLGIDIFCAVPEVWQRAAAEIPEGYTLGRQKWDTWALAFFMAHWPEQCYDFSKSACIFHPIHGERGCQECTVAPDIYVNNIKWPHKFIEL